MPYGPVQMLVLEFDRAEFDGEILPELKRLKRKRSGDRRKARRGNSGRVRGSGHICEWTEEKRDVLSSCCELDHSLRDQLEARKDDIIAQPVQSFLFGTSCLPDRSTSHLYQCFFPRRRTSAERENVVHPETMSWMPSAFSGNTHPRRHRSRTLSQLTVTKDENRNGQGTEPEGDPDQREYGPDHVVRSFPRFGGRPGRGYNTHARGMLERPHHPEGMTKRASSDREDDLVRRSPQGWTWKGTTRRP
jgi:hypothetical protein